MDAYTTVLLLVHIGGAIAGIGPTFAFGVLGSMAERAGGERALSLLEAMQAIESRIVRPVALVTQPASGALLIFQTGRNDDFFAHQWLWIAILLYAIVLYFSYLVSSPHIMKMITMMREGKGESEEFRRIAVVEQRLGLVFGALLVVIVVLMIWKPGD